MNRLVLLASLIAFAAAAGPATGQAPPAAAPAAPSAAAVELARLLRPGSFLGFERPTDAQAAAALEQRLLQNHFAPVGRPCHPDNAECIAAARQVASQYGPVRARFYEGIVEEGWARLLDAKLGRADMAAAAGFFRSGSGRKMADALRLNMLGGAEDDRELLERIYAETLAGKVAPDKGMFEDFYRRTASLPRAPLPLVRPPPQITPPR